MKVSKFVVNYIEENCFLLWDEATKESALIDCGAMRESEWDTIQAKIQQEGFTLKYALQTHCHFDHLLGIGFVHAAYGLSPRFHMMEQVVYDAMPQMAARFLITLPFPLPQPGPYLEDGQILTLGTETLRVFHTPGHTPGGVCFYSAENAILFSGDTLFQGSIGRTDLGGGDMDQELHSIRTRLFTLPPETLVYPGHGPSTTIAQEQAHNPYF